VAPLRTSGRTRDNGAVRHTAAYVVDEVKSGPADGGRIFLGE
jgi:hypothetical protein